MNDERRRFTDTDVGQLVEQLAPRLDGGPPPSRADFVRLEAKVDGIIEAMGEVEGDMARVDERQKSEAARATENDRRLAEALAQVSRNVREVDRRQTESIEKANQSIGTTDAKANKAHARIDRWAYSFGGGLTVATAFGALLGWLFDHFWKSHP